MLPSIDPPQVQERACELKFLVSLALASELHRWASGHLAPDPYADPAEGNAYAITSLYFDTPGFHVLRRIGSFARSKYRIRRYDHRANIFLERKLKTNGRVSKRRTPASVRELSRLADGDLDRHWRGYWYHRCLLVRELRPVCQIRYCRAAWVGASSQGPLRLTLDDRVRTVAVSEAAFDDASAGLQLLDEQVILELKYRNEPPALFKRLIEEFALKPQPVSKYRLAAAALGLATEFGTSPDSAVSPRSTLCAMG